MTPRPPAGGKGSNQYQTKGASRATQRVGSGATATATETPPKVVADQVRKLLASGPFKSDLPPNYGTTHVQVSTNKKNRTMKVEWASGPQKEVVAAVVDPVASANDVSVEYRRVQRWACGYYHQGVEDAFVTHDAEDLKEWVGGCACCGEGSEFEVPAETMERLRAEGDIESSCQPGEYEQCPRCGGLGVDRENFKKPCPVCQGARVFDMDVPEQAAVFKDSMVKIKEEAWASYRASLSARKERAKSRLP